MENIIIQMEIIKCLKELQISLIEFILKYIHKMQNYLNNYTQQNFIKENLKMNKNLQQLIGNGAVMKYNNLKKLNQNQKIKFYNMKILKMMKLI